MKVKLGRKVSDLSGLKQKSDILGVSEYWNSRTAPKYMEADGEWGGRYWQKAGARWVHPDIPNPVNEESEEFGWRSVRGDGGWYDYETGRRLEALSILRLTHGS